MKKGEVGEYFSKCNCIKYAVENLVIICEDGALINTATNTISSRSSSFFLFLFF